MSGDLPERVLHVMHSATGGAAMSTVGLIAALAERGITSSIVCANFGSDADKAVLMRATEGRALFTDLYWWNRKTRAALWKRPILEARQWAKTGGTVLSTRHVARFAERTKCDLIHTNTLCLLEGGKAAQLLGLPHVWHARELAGPGQYMEFPLSGRAFGGKLESLSSMVIANSETMAGLLRPHMDQSRVALVYNGIDMGAFSALGANALGRAPGHTLRGDRRPVVVSMVANLTSMGKQHPLFIEAAALVEQPGVEFRLYGEDQAEGATASRYIARLHEQVAQLGLEGRVSFCGFRGSPVDIMAESDIVVHPAGNESFGRSVVEAMAAALPVVGVAAGGVGETVLDGVTGFLVPEHDARGLADAIRRLAASAELRLQMGDAGRQRAQDLFSLDACANGVIDVYRASATRPVAR
jgi:glycosyltransferase involved in cell wall biosynthesis